MLWAVAFGRPVAAVQHGTVVHMAIALPGVRVMQIAVSVTINPNRLEVPREASPQGHGRR